MCIIIIASCSNPKAPSQYTDSEQLPQIFPEYQGVTVPVNIAPLTFTIQDEGSDFVTRLTVGGREWLYAGQDVCPTQKQWKQMVNGKWSNGKW